MLHEMGHLRQKESQDLVVGDDDDPVGVRVAAVPAGLVVVVEVLLSRGGHAFAKVLLLVVLAAVVVMP